MSNENAVERPKQNGPQLTRIRVKHLFFADNIDLDGGLGQVSNLGPNQNLLPEPPPAPTANTAATKHYLCNFIPAWQAFELIFHPGGTSTPRTQMLPAVHVRRWEVAA